MNNDARGRLQTFRLIQVKRPGLDNGRHLIGVKLASGREWMVIARMSDDIEIDGFDALRMADIARIEQRFPRRALYLNSLQSRRATVPFLQTLALDSTSRLLRSAQQWFGLVVIDREEANPGAAEIGRVMATARNSYRLRLVSSYGKWESKVRRYPTAEVTRIGFGGRYASALADSLSLKDSRWE